ncbi:metal-dependent transcriptional regulator [Lactobacillus sp. DCY120]|uniref:Manganese transport regulator n=1 Tax=Bombilactobacillus apium TaxID=2675299 RepID=A0A850R6U0_9LACO|nr:metal-dependent transcriptional regulator [Bombilactobacillus apium]NVY96362.1 metal-dependent transcriptional regulator [Bombilactobacillus apium]
MSPSKENYLKSIFELQHSFQKVTNKRLAEMMHVSAPSVTEMLLTLKKAGYLKYNPYTAISLTSKGRTTAEALVKKHRLWEVFLVDKLHYQINEVDQIAGDLEHFTDQKLVNSLNEFLAYPQKCPHGGVIPDNGQGETDDDDLVLSLVAPQTKVQIVRVIDDREFLDYFTMSGLKINQIITVLQHSQFDDSVLIQTSTGKEVSVSRKSADFIFVEPAK